MATSSKPMTRELLISERLVCVIVIAVSAYCLVETFNFPTLSADPGGGALFPRIAAGLAMLGSLIVLIRGLPAFRGEQTGTSDKIPFAALIRNPTTQVIVLSAAYPWFIMKAGFPVSTAVYIVLLMTVLRVPMRIAIPYGIVVAAALYFVFVYALEAYVPAGEWMAWITD